MSKLCRSLYRSAYLLILLIAASIDGRIRRPKVGAEGAIWIHNWCHRIVNALRIECTIKGSLPTSGAVVSNHLSYLDILLYSATTPFVMVAKKELRSWPLLGWLTAQAGTVYVQRSEDRRPGELRQEHSEVNGMMAEAYASGLPVLFFPEGTTTDGEQVLPFRRGLFHSVLNGGIPLRTAALQFQVGERDRTAIVGRDVCFVGDALFGPHIFQCLGLHELKAQIKFGGEVLQREDRFVLSQSAHAAVSELHGSLADRPKYASEIERRYEKSHWPEGLANAPERP
ncbi:lysophospholipid acyltransferase family protein [Granulicella arctica]|uniref:lysophospholipid acyltransferase family protein n=1 Tax=Granulicella arctica TaxID=940613 RepID=UPI0021DFD256|nr:lysophospholipid acyltransferase family protein [Granulicella arctica]